MQEAYCRIAMLPAVDHIEHPVAYLYSVARNLVLRRIKRQQVVMLDVVADIECFSDDSLQSPERQAESRMDYQRVLAIIAERSTDADAVRAAFAANALRDARGDIAAYLSATAPSAQAPAIAAFDAAPNRAAAIAAARQVVAERAPNALTAFPSALPRYQLVDPPASRIEDMRPYLDGTRMLPDLYVNQPKS